VGIAVATIEGGGKEREIAHQQELPTMVELPWQQEEEEEEGGWSEKSLIAMRWLPTGQTSQTLWCKELRISSGYFLLKGGGVSG
jgi:hypothetical protein